MLRERVALLFSLLLAGAGCSSAVDVDGAADATVADSGARDAVALDAPPMDAPPADAGVDDGSAPDAFADDATTPDAFADDASAGDASGPDGAPDDATLDAATDGSSTDASTIDASLDGGAADAGCACDDGIDCTLDRCAPDGTCTHVAIAARCPTDDYCSATTGCVAPGPCAGPADCPRPDFCTTASCNAATATCRYATLDGDHDGAFPPICGGDDCDDSVATTHPGATETCNLVDDDCDGTVDGTAADPSCSAGDLCVAGFCQCPPPIHMTCGFGSCVDVTGNPSNCGACGNVCAAGSTCSASACHCDDTTLSYCSAGCTDTRSDPANCGACGHYCPSGGMCMASLCGCPASTTLCATEGRCADLSSSTSDCGACGHDCGYDAVCSTSTCEVEGDWGIGYGASGGTLDVTLTRVAPAGDHLFLMADAASTFVTDTATSTTWGPADPVLLRLSSDGVTAWDVSPGLTTPRDMTADAAGDAYVVGSRPSGFSTMGVIRKLGAAAGALVREQTIPIMFSGDRDVVASIALLPSGDVVVVGTARGSPDLGGGPLASSPDGFGYVFGTDGTYRASWRIPGVPTRVAVTASGRVVVASSFTGTVTVGTDTLTASGATDWFVASYTSSGSVLADFAVHATVDHVATLGDDVVIDSDAGFFLERRTAAGVIVWDVRPAGAIGRGVATDATHVYALMDMTAAPLTFGSRTLNYVGTHLVRFDTAGTLDAAVLVQVDTRALAATSGHLLVGGIGYGIVSIGTVGFTMPGGGPFVGTVHFTH